MCLCGVWGVVCGEGAVLGRDGCGGCMALVLFVGHVLGCRALWGKCVSCECLSVKAYLWFMFVCG